jgi:hypothetical protein
MRQARLVGRLQQAGPKGSVHLNRRIDNIFGYSLDIHLDLRD